MPPADSTCRKRTSGVDQPADRRGAVEVGQLLGVQVDVHDAEEAVVGVHDREGEQAVLDEELAGVEDRGRGGQGDDLRRP